MVVGVNYIDIIRFLLTHIYTHFCTDICAFTIFYRQLNKILFITPRHSSSVIGMPEIE